MAVLLFGFPTPSTFVFSGESPLRPVEVPSFRAPVVPVLDPAVRSVESFLKGYGVDASHRGRVAESIVASAKKYNLDPRLIASVVIVESRANPFAISGSDAIGIMQIHLPTWGHTAERDGINLFKVEDNIDFGARILRDYIRQGGVWDGVKRYKGWSPDDPQSEQSALDYVAKVQRIFEYKQPETVNASLLQ